MVRIVAGNQEDINAPLLAGLQFGKTIGENRRRAEQDRQKTEMELQKAMAEYKKEQAKALADTNEQAALGDLAAIQMQAMETRRASAPPDKQYIDDLVGAAGKISDPEIRSKAIKEIDDLVGHVKLQEGYQAAGSEIERAVKDGLVDESGAQTLQQRLQMKAQRQESADDLLTELTKARHDRNVKATNMQENQEAIDKAAQFIQTIPPGRERKLAMIALNEYQMSPSLQEREGAGAAILGKVQEIAVGTQKRYDELQAGRAEMMNQQPAPGLPGMTVGQRNEQMMRTPNEPVGFGLLGEHFGTNEPNIPPLQDIGTHATLNGKAAEQQKQDPVYQMRLAAKAALKSGIAKSDKEFIELLRKHSDFKFTPENAAILNQALYGEDPGGDAAAE